MKNWKTVLCCVTVGGTGLDWGLCSDYFKHTLISKKYIHVCVMCYIQLPTQRPIIYNDQVNRECLWIVNSSVDYGERYREKKWYKKKFLKLKLCLIKTESSLSVFKKKFLFQTWTGKAGEDENCQRRNGTLVTVFIRPVLYFLTEARSLLGLDPLLSGRIQHFSYVWWWWNELGVWYDKWILYTRSLGTHCWRVEFLSVFCVGWEYVVHPIE